MTESDNRSEKAFKITKNVGMSTAQTLKEVRSGCCGSCEVTDQLQAKNESLKIVIALLNSMVLCGEEHSEKSRKIVRKALKGE